MQKITPFLWFSDQAEQAVDFYLSIFENSKIKNTVRYDKQGAEVSGRPEGTVMTITFELEGQEFVALNGGPEFKFSPAISFMVNCQNQQEIDFLWEKLSEGGQEMPCGWVTDKFGVTWQIIHEELDALIQDEDPEKSKHAMKAMLEMKKIDIEAIKQAHDQP